MKTVFFSSSEFILPLLSELIKSSKNGLSLYELYLKSFKDIASEQLYNFNLISEAVEDYKDALQKESFALVCVVSAQDKYNRSKLIPNPVATLAKNNDLKTFQPHKLSQSFDEFIEVSGDFDLGITASFGQIITNQLLEYSKYGFINWHPSKLPLYRGATPMQSALKNGEQLTALSWIKMTEEVDAGDILLQIDHEIDANKDLLGLTNDMVELGVSTFGIAIIIHFLEEKFGLKLSSAQDSSKASFTKMIKKEDKLIDLNHFDSKNLFNHFRAYSSYPKVFFVDSQYFHSQVRLDSLNLINLAEFGLSYNFETNLFEINSESKIEYQDSLWLQISINKQKVTFIKLKNELIKVNKVTLENGKTISFSGFNF
jgi:methionyl-tRNA formyltransferase